MKELMYSTYHSTDLLVVSKDLRIKGMVEANKQWTIVVKDTGLNEKCAKAEGWMGERDVSSQRFESVKITREMK